MLYQSRLHPEEAVSSLADDHISALHGAIRDVVQFACGVEADDAQFPRTWIFHYRCVLLSSWIECCYLGRFRIVLGRWLSGRVLGSECACVVVYAVIGSVMWRDQVAWLAVRIHGCIAAAFVRCGG